MTIETHEAEQIREIVFGGERRTVGYVYEWFRANGLDSLGAKRWIDEYDRKHNGGTK